MAPGGANETRNRDPRMNVNRDGATPISATTVEDRCSISELPATNYSYPFAFVRGSLLIAMPANPNSAR